MRERRGRAAIGELCSGPGKLAQALGIGLELSGASLLQAPFAWRPRESDPVVVTGPRIGITKGVDLPWRFSVAGDPFVSRPRPAEAVVSGA